MVGGRQREKDLIADLQNPRARVGAQISKRVAEPVFQDQLSARLAEITGVSLF